MLYHWRSMLQDHTYRSGTMHNHAVPSIELGQSCYKSDGEDLADNQLVAPFMIRWSVWRVLKIIGAVLLMLTESFSRAEKIIL